jgi:hypothetical protein
MGGALARDLQGRGEIQNMKLYRKERCVEKRGRTVSA